MTNDKKTKFLSDLSELSIRHGIVIEENCCCCGGMNIKADVSKGRYFLPTDYDDDVIEWEPEK